MTWLEHKWQVERDRKMDEAKAKHGDVPICSTCFNPYRIGPMWAFDDALICDTCGMAMATMNHKFRVSVNMNRNGHVWK